MLLLHAHCVAVCCYCVYSDPNIGAIAGGSVAGVLIILIAVVITIIVVVIVVKHKQKNKRELSQCFCTFVAVIL